MCKKVFDEVKLNKGFRPKLAVFTYRMGYIFKNEKNYLIKLIAWIMYQLLKVVCWLFSCGDIPSSKIYIGYGLRIPHAFQGVIMTSGTRIGENCTILHNVTLGSINNSKGYQNNIIIGNNVFIGAGTLILGNSTIGDGCSVGAGTKLISASVPNNCTVVNKYEYRIIEHKIEE